jgi:hypothetical protein
MFDTFYLGMIITKHIRITANHIITQFYTGNSFKFGLSGTGLTTKDNYNR